MFPLPLNAARMFGQDTEGPPSETLPCFIRGCFGFSEGSVALWVESRFIIDLILDAIAYGPKRYMSSSVSSLMAAERWS